MSVSLQTLIIHILSYTCISINAPSLCLSVCNSHNSRTVHPTDFKFDFDTLFTPQQGVQCSVSSRTHGCPEPPQKASVWALDRDPAQGPYIELASSDIILTSA